MRQVRALVSAKVFMLLRSAKVPALVLLSVFLAGGVISPFAHRITHNSPEHSKRACEHDAALGLHLDEQAGTVKESCLQCVRHHVQDSEDQPVVQVAPSAEQYYSALQEVLAQHSALGRQARAPPPALA